MQQKKINTELTTKECRFAMLNFMFKDLNNCKCTITEHLYAQCTFLIRTWWISYTANKSQTQKCAYMWNRLDFCPPKSKEVSGWDRHVPEFKNIQNEQWRWDKGAEYVPRMEVSIFPAPWWDSGSNVQMKDFKIRLQRHCNYKRLLLWALPWFLQRPHRPHFNL